MIHNPAQAFSAPSKMILRPRTGFLFLLTPEKGRDWVADVNLLKEGFGVSVIIPKTLADDLNVMKGNKLEKFAAEYRSKKAVFLSRSSEFSALTN